MCCVFLSRHLPMAHQGVCVQLEVTVLQLHPLPFPALPAPSATAQALAAQSSVLAVHQGKV